MKKKGLVIIGSLVIIAGLGIVISLNTPKSSDLTKSDSKKASGQDSEQESEKLSEQKLSEAYTAYADYLETHELLGFGKGVYARPGTNNYLVYSFEYIDADDIPELVYGDTNASQTAQTGILKYVNGQVVNSLFDTEDGEFHYYEKKNVIYTSCSEGENTIETYLRLNEDGEVRKIYSLEKNENDSKDKKDSVSPLDSMKTGMFDTKAIGWYSRKAESNFDFMSEESIENLRKFSGISHSGDYYCVGIFNRDHQKRAISTRVFDLDIAENKFTVEGRLSYSQSKKKYYDKDEHMIDANHSYEFDLSEDTSYVLNEDGKEKSVSQDKFLKAVDGDYGVDLELFLKDGCVTKAVFEP